MSKKDQELRDVLELKQVYSAFPEGTIVPGESPDFVVQNERRIGIEHTKYTKAGTDKGSSAMHAEASRKKVVLEAWSLFRRSSSTALVVYVHWTDLRPVPNQDIPAIATWLCAAVESSMPPETEGARSLAWDDLKAYGLQDRISRVSIRRDDALYRRGFWDTVEAGVLAPDVAQLQACIDLKESKLSGYRQNVDETWLLIVSGDFHMATNLDAERVAEEVKEQPLKTSFDHVILFDRFGRKACELARGAS